MLVLVVEVQLELLRACSGLVSAPPDMCAEKFTLMSMGAKRRV